jgi:hypothetical protein
MWTLNNYTEEEVTTLKELVFKYISFGYEVGESGTPHLQGVICFETLKSVGQVIKLMPTRVSNIQSIIHLQEAIEYAQKDGDFYENGTRPKSAAQKGVLGGIAQKDKWDQIWDNARSGNMGDIPPEIMIKHYRTLKEIRKDHMPPVASIPVLENEWIYGPSGTGKTSGVLARYPDCYLKTCNKWWDGYQDEETVLIDDIDENHRVLIHHLKIWGDHKPFLAETKGGMLKIRPKRIICTSNVPLSVFASAPHLEPLQRRYQEIEKPEIIQYQDNSEEAYVEIHMGPLI